MLQKYRALFSALLLFFILPSLAFASVRLSEIAWMGTLVSGTDEWIELFNDGSSAVDLSGWHLEAQDGSPSIELSGSIAPSGYFLIERTDDTTVPDVAADLVAAFGNGLGNTGETLLLKDSTGAVVDTVVGGTNWDLIGGNNTTKETPQRQSAGTSWVTGTPTPRSANVGGGEVLGAATTNTASSNGSSNTTTTASTTGTVSQKPAYSSSVYPRDSMTVSSGRDLETFVGLQAKFSGSALGLYDETLPYATYRWNFGDGATGSGREVTHVYQFPGVYTVILQVSNASLLGSDRMVVSVVEPPVVVGRVQGGAQGFVELSNQSDREVDCSSWVLSTGDRRFVFASNTILPAHRATMFPNTVTGLNGDLGAPVLSYPDGTRVGDVHVSNVPTLVTGEPQKPIPGTVSEVVSHDTLRTVSAARTPSAPVSITAVSDIATTSPAAATVLWSREGKSSVPLLGQGLTDRVRWFFVVLGMFLLVAAGVILLRSRIDQPSPADEYAIISDIIDDGEEIDLTRK